MTPLQLFCIGDTLASMVNLESIIPYPPHVFPNALIPLIGPVATMVGSGRYRYDGQIDSVLPWSGFTRDYFSTLIYAIFGSWTVSSVQKYLFALDESRRWSPFLVQVNRPHSPTPSKSGDYEIGAGGSVRNLRIPITNCVQQVAYKSSNATLTASERLVLVDTSGGTKTITLPPAGDVQPHSPIAVEKAAAANTLNVTDGGSLTVSTTTNHHRLILVSDGSAWAQWRA